MKTNSPKNNRLSNHRRAAFTLIEMIGVLAVIAILAAVLIPKIFEAINNARVNNAAMSCNTVKTALADHYAKAGSLLADASTNPPVVLTPPVEQFYLVLLKEAFMDKPFATKIGDGIIDATHTRVRAVGIDNGPGGLNWTAAQAVDGTGATGFALAGGGTNSVVGSAAIEAVITGVTAGDAKDLNDRLDGPALGSAINAADFNGRVKYAAPSGGVTDVYIYLTHR